MKYLKIHEYIIIIKKIISLVTFELAKEQIQAFILSFLCEMDSQTFLFWEKSCLNINVPVYI